MQNIGVIGTGIWGTALALTATRAGNNVLCWAREPEVVESINYAHVNKLFLPDIPLPDSIKATPNIAEVFDFADIILLTVSAQYTRIRMQQIKPYIKNSTVLVLCAKGIEQSSGQMLSEIAAEEIPEAQIAVLSGPGFAIDVAKQKIASVTIGCEKEKIALTFLGDGKILSFMNAMDIYSLLGNAIDNSIEALKHVEEVEKRIISINLENKGDITNLTIRNYFDGELQLDEDGLPFTSKQFEKGYHGYGMKSMRLIARKYSGNLSIRISGNIFVVNIYLMR